MNFNFYLFETRNTSFPSHSLEIFSYPFSLPYCCTLFAGIYTTKKERKPRNINDIISPLEE